MEQFNNPPVKRKYVSVPTTVLKENIIKLREILNLKNSVVSDDEEKFYTTKILEIEEELNKRNYERE